MDTRLNLHIEYIMSPVFIVLFSPLLVSFNDKFSYLWIHLLKLRPISCLKSHPFFPLLIRQLLSAHQPSIILPSTRLSSAYGQN